MIWDDARPGLARGVPTHARRVVGPPPGPLRLMQDGQVLEALDGVEVTLAEHLQANR